VWVVVINKHSGPVILILAAIILVVVAGNLIQQGYPIVFVIPEKYQGPIILIIDNQRGEEVPLMGDKYTYRIHEDGKLPIKDASPFHQGHSLEVIYTNGKRVAVERGDNVKPEVVLFHVLESGVKANGEEYIKFFIGTKAALKGYFEKEPIVRLTK
jgi:hypothetical protein